MNQPRQTLREYISGAPRGVVAPEAEAAILMPPLPRASQKRGHYRWSARWAGQGRLTFAPKTGKRPGGVAEINHENMAVTCSFVVELRGFEPLTPSMRTLTTTVDSGRCRWPGARWRHSQAPAVGLVAARVAAPPQMG